MKASIKDICSYLDSAVPLSYQASYDNSGLQVFAEDRELVSALLTVDVTEDVVEEAVALGCGLIISHHPLIFSPLKKVTGRTHPERIVIKALQAGVAVYSAHTNLDSAYGGISWKMAEKLSLKNVRVLVALKGNLLKLVTYIPEDHFKVVSEAVFAAGAGVTGNYDRCGFSAQGYGTFRGNENSDPFVGKRGEDHRERELRFETVLESHLKDKVIKALLKAHPYEEVAYDIIRLENIFERAGEGCIGELEQEMSEKDFLKYLSKVFDSRGLRYSQTLGRPVRKVALCGGAGAGLVTDAVRAGADAYVTGDVKYHDFANAEGDILLADIGHFEGEKYATEILYDLIIKKFPTFALRFSEKNTNPINYL
jgi:dinuclear metal center YbgI/SA1388 family protein